MTEHDVTVVCCRLLQDYKLSQAMPATGVTIMAPVTRRQTGPLAGVPVFPLPSDCLGHKLWKLSGLTVEEFVFGTNRRYINIKEPRDCAAMRGLEGGTVFTVGYHITKVLLGKPKLGWALCREAVSIRGRMIVVPIMDPMATTHTYETNPAAARFVGEQFKAVLPEIRAAAAANMGLMKR